jgi:hypothetical protein
MVRLDRYSDRPEYKGIDLKCCGLLFLSTPHSSSTEADWNKFLTEFAQVALGVRPEVVNLLRPFSPWSAASQDFATMKYHPPFDCVYETKTTVIMTFNRTVSEPSVNHTKRTHH